MRNGGWLLALAALLSGRRAALAQTNNQQLEVRWQAPGECPSDLSFLRLVEGFLGERLDRVDDQPLSIDAHVLGDTSHGYAAKLSFTSRESTTVRVLDHPDCNKLSEAAALLTALAIDPERVNKVRAQGAAQAEPVNPSSAEAPVPVVPRLGATSIASQPGAPPPHLTTTDTLPEPRKRTNELRFGMAIHGLVAKGSLPNAGPGIGLELASRWRLLEAGIGGRYWFSRGIAVPGAPTARVDLSIVTATLRACLAPRRGAWSVTLCARGDWGDMVGHGEGVDNAHARHDVYLAFGGGASAAYSVGRLSPLAGVEALALGARPSFGVLRDGREQEVFRPRKWQVTGFFGLAYAL